MDFMLEFNLIKLEIKLFRIRLAFKIDNDKNNKLTFRIY